MQVHYTHTITIDHDWFRALFAGQCEGSIAIMLISCMDAALGAWPRAGRHEAIAHLLARDPDELACWADIIAKAQKIAADARNESGQAGKGSD